MSAVQDTSDIWRRLRNDKVALCLDLAIWAEFRLVELLLLPPIVPRRLDDRRNVGLVVGIIQRLEDLLLSLGRLLDVWGECLLLLLWLLLLGLRYLVGTAILLLCLLCCELGRFLGFGTFFGDWKNKLSASALVRWG